VVCHASAWDVDLKLDLRVKMCIQIREEDFGVIHHELGHNFYQRAYNTQPPLFQNSANDGFHEAVGDTIALSVTPEYLKQIGLIDVVPPPSAIRITCCSRRWRKWRSCHSACWWTSGGGKYLPAR